MSADAPPRGSLLLLGRRESMFFHSFFDVSFVHPFANTRQLAEQREPCLLRLLPRQCMRGGSQNEEKPFLTSGGHATVHSGINIGSNIAQSMTRLLMWHVFNNERCV